MRCRTAAAAYASILILLSTPVEAQAISGDCFRSLVAYASRAPKITPVNAGISEPLGLASAGAPFLSRQAVIRERDLSYAFAVGADDRGKILIFSINNANRTGSFFVVSPVGTLTGAASVEGGKVTLRNTADPNVRVDFESELKIWSSAILDGVANPSCNQL